MLPRARVDEDVCAVFDRGVEKLRYDEGAMLTDRPARESWTGIAAHHRLR